MARHFSRAGNSHLRVDATPVTAAPFTMACWGFNSTSNNNKTAMFVGDKDVSDQWWVLRWEGAVSGDPLRLARKAGGDTDSVDTTTGFSASTWHHGAAVIAAANDARVFIDGSSKATSTVTRAPSGADRVTIGRSDDSTPGNNWGGEIAEAGIWDVALTDDEILSLASGVAPIRVRPGNLVGYWPLYAGFTGNEADYSRNSNTLVEQNTVTGADHAPVQPMWGFDLGWQGAFTAAAGGLSIPVAMHNYYRQRQWARA